jgi:hypothetical protein
MLTRNFPFDDGSVGHSHGIASTWQETPENSPALAADALKPLEFGEWLRMIIHAQVEVRPLVFAIDE